MVIKWQILRGATSSCFRLPIRNFLINQLVVDRQKLSVFIRVANIVAKAGYDLIFVFRQRLVLSFDLQDSVCTMLLST